MRFVTYCYGCAFIAAFRTWLHAVAQACFLERQPALQISSLEFGTSSKLSTLGLIVVSVNWDLTAMFIIAARLFLQPQRAMENF